MRSFAQSPAPTGLPHVEVARVPAPTNIQRSLLRFDMNMDSENMNNVVIYLTIHLIIPLCFTEKLY